MNVRDTGNNDEVADMLAMMDAVDEAIAQYDEELRAGHLRAIPLRPPEPVRFSFDQGRVSV